jgi:uncharacterized glyoxalase superfamily protein PhnB
MALGDDADDNSFPMPRPNVIPTLRYADCDAAIEWLVHVLGAEPRTAFRNAAGGVMHAELQWGNGVLMLGDQPAADEPGRLAVETGPSWTYLATDDDPSVAAAFERAVEMKAEVVQPLTQQEYGGSDFTLRDPGGHLWSVGSYRPGAGGQASDRA